MEKKTIGQFIAALRKANGMTQQDVADRLNVSNKAISRWERDECAPDITLIPALAEMFGVTCDELLKGERITYTAQAEKIEPKVEKQLKALMNRTISNFKTLIWIAIALSLVGLICMFGISYGFYRPVIGFAVMLLFEAAALTVAAIVTNKMKEAKIDNEIFENAETALLSRYDKALGSYSFHAFFVVLSVILLSLPLILPDYGYVKMVMTFRGYLPIAGTIVLVLALIYLKGKEPYCKWIAGSSLNETHVVQSKRVAMLNYFQLGAMVISGVMFVIIPYFDELDVVTPAYMVLSIIASIIFISSILSFVFFIIRYKDDRKELLLPGIRNMLFLPCAYFMMGIHGVIWLGESEWGPHTREEYWDVKYLFYAIIWAALVVVVFKVVERLRKKRMK